MKLSEPAVPGKPYCQEHLKLCYAPRSTGNSVDKIIERLAIVAARECELFPVGFELNKAAPVWQDHVADARAARKDAFEQSGGACSFERRRDGIQAVQFER
jgi:hypothetical protein